MQIAVFGKKYENNLDTFLSELIKALNAEGVKKRNIDLSYFESDIDNDFNNSQKVFSKIKKTIFNSDAIIIEATSKSEGISFISGFSLALNKPTLMLFDKNTRSSDMSFSTVLMGTSTLNRSYLEKYDAKDTNSLKSAVRNFVKNTKKQIESKFYVILSPEINRYLEWWSYSNRTTKVSKIRELLTSDMHKNSDWKKITD